MSWHGYTQKSCWEHYEQSVREISDRTYHMVSFWIVEKNLTGNAREWDENEGYVRERETVNRQVPTEGYHSIHFDVVFACCDLCYSTTSAYN